MTIILKGETCCKAPADETSTLPAFVVQKNKTTDLISIHLPIEISNWIDKTCNGRTTTKQDGMEQKVPFSP